MKNLTEENIKELLLETYFPIGAVYMASHRDANPTEYFGGQWELIDTTTAPDCFIRNKIIFTRIE